MNMPRRGGIANSDHHWLEAERILLGERVAEAIKGENRRYPGTHARRRRCRFNVIVNRWLAGLTLRPFPTPIEEERPRIGLIPACRYAQHHWADRISSQGNTYTRYCVRCGVIVDGPWDNPQLVSVRQLTKKKELRPVRPIKSTAKAPRIEALIQRDGQKCWYCGCRLAREKITLDHIVPRSKGGTNALDNLCLACPRCNTRKADMPVDRFRALVGGG